MCTTPLKHKTLPINVDAMSDKLDARRSGGITIGELFDQQVARTPDAVAVRDHAGVRTYRQLDERVHRLCHVLIGLGVRRGDRVVVLSENRVEYVELHLAAARFGAILAAQNWRQSAAEMGHCIGLVEPAATFVSERYAPVLARLAVASVPVVQLGAPYEELLSAADATARDWHVEPEDGLVILYTSGTTGLPKGALISHRAMVARGMIARIDGSAWPGESFVAWAPLFHVVSTDPTFATLTHGGTVMVMDGLDVEALVAFVSREEIGHLVLMPGMIDRVLDEFSRTGLRPRRVRTVGCMADLVPIDQIVAITTLCNAPYRNTFGSTEAGTAPGGRGNIAVGTRPERLSKLQSSYCVVRLVDLEGATVADGLPGELTLRSPTLFSGYWNADATNEHDFRGGWFHTGDVFVRNADGSLDFVDRRKYLIKSGGENIYPAEIERVLLGDPRIREAVVVRRADPRWGEVPVAFVVAKEPRLSGDEVRDICRGRIASFKLPREIIFLEAGQMPLSTTGKVKRHELEAMLLPSVAASRTSGG